MTLKPWPIEWTAENTADFWAWAATAPAMRDEYFAKKHGHNILRLARPYIASP